MNDKLLIVKIIEIIKQVGELASDGECIDQIWNLLVANGYDPDNF
jgi:hypothetical protein